MIPTKLIFHDIILIKRHRCEEKMKEALNPKNELIDSLNADYGIYFCPECTCIVYLRIMDDKAPHFYHFRKNITCSLSSDSTSDAKWLNQTITDKINLLKNSTSENWNEAIQWLLQNGHINRLATHEWASNKIGLYILNNTEIISKQHFIELLLLLLHYNNESSIKSVLHYFDHIYLSDTDRIGICKEMQKIKNQFSEELSALILSTLPVENMLMLFSSLTTNIQRFIRRTTENYIERILSIINTKLDFTKRYEVLTSLQYKFHRKFYSLEEKEKTNTLLQKVLSGMIDTDSKRLFLLLTSAK